MKNNKNQNKNQIHEGFSMRDCLSQETVNKMYSLHKRGRKKPNTK